MKQSVSRGQRATGVTRHRIPRENRLELRCLSRTRGSGVLFHFTLYSFVHQNYGLNTGPRGTFKHNDVLLLFFEIYSIIVINYSEREHLKRVQSI